MDKKISLDPIEAASDITTPKKVLARIYRESYGKENYGELELCLSQNISSPKRLLKCLLHSANEFVQKRALETLQLKKAYKLLDKAALELGDKYLLHSTVDDYTYGHGYSRYFREKATEWALNKRADLLKDCPVKWVNCPDYLRLSGIMQRWLLIGK